MSDKPEDRPEERRRTGPLGDDADARREPPGEADGEPPGRVPPAICVRTALRRQSTGWGGLAGHRRLNPRPGSRPGRRPEGTPMRLDVVLQSLRSALALFCAAVAWSSASLARLASLVNWSDRAMSTSLVF